MRYLACFAILFVASPCAIGQALEYDFFSQDLIKRERVQIVATYEIPFYDFVREDSQKVKIKLARNLVKEAFFDKEGRIEKHVWYGNGGETVTDVTKWEYRQDGKIDKRIYEHFTQNRFDSTVVEITMHYVHGYDDRGQKTAQLVQLVNDTVEITEDSTSYGYDLEGNLVLEETWHPGAAKPTTIAYRRDRARLVITEHFGAELLRKEEIELNASGERSVARLFKGEEVEPRKVEYYSYNLQGRLEKVRTDHIKEFFQSVDPVEVMTMKFDPQGKVSEQQFELESGNQSLWHYDYTYFGEE